MRWLLLLIAAVASFAAYLLWIHGSADTQVANEREVRARLRALPTEPAREARDEKGYRDVTDSAEPEVVAARKRFEKILAGLPAPGPDDPLLRKYREWRERKRGARRRAKPRPGKKASKS